MKYKVLFSIICLSIVSCTEPKGTTMRESIESIESAEEVKEPKATFVHTVYFWMKEGATEEQNQFFEEEIIKLGKCPSILSYKWGTPAGTPRDVVDNSYAYALIEEFANMEDQKVYQDDPIHLAFIENCKDLWSRVQVYDTNIDLR